MRVLALHFGKLSRRRCVRVRACVRARVRMRVPERERVLGVDGRACGRVCAEACAGSWVRTCAPVRVCVCGGACAHA